MIQIKNLLYEYFRRDDQGEVTEIVEAVDGVNLTIEQGEFVVILGHNGSGKSTLARHLNGMLQPTEGTVVIDGLNTREEELLWQIRKKNGMVFQNPDNQIVGTMVEEDTAFGPENLGVETEEIWNRVKENQNRPLLICENPQEKIHVMMHQRHPIYSRAAHVEVKTDGRNVDAIAAEIYQVSNKRQLR